MNEYELFEKLKELSKLLDDYTNGKIEKSKYDWSKEIQRESQDIIRKSHIVGAAGSPCSCCGGSGRA